MKKLIKKYLILLIITIMVSLMNANVYAFNTSLLKATSTSISGVCKIYGSEKTYYYKKDSSGSYSQKVDEEEVRNVRNSIKRMLDTEKNLKSKILKGDTYYNNTYKEFCYKRSDNNTGTDTLSKVILIGYDDNYTFRSDLATGKGAYKAKYVGENETFYISYEDTWVESEIDKVYNATSISLDKYNVELRVGESIEIKYTVLPDEAISKSVRVAYTENVDVDISVIGTVKITALKNGDAYITVKLKDNEEIYATCAIKINSKDNPVVPDPVKDENVTSTEYLVDKQKKLISKIKPKININSFIKNITADVDYKIVDAKGNNVSNTSNVATGMKLKTEKNEYTMIVKGDINGDGKITITDVVRVNLYSVKNITPNEIESIAADVNGDGRVTITDVVRINLASVGMLEI